MSEKPTYEKLAQRVAELEKRYALGRLSEETLRKSEETSRALLNATSDSAILIDTEGTIIAINEIAVHRLGKVENKVLGMNLFDMFPPDVAKKRKTRADEVIRSGDPAHFEDQSDGGVFNNTFYPLFDRRGKVEKLAVYSRDIAEQRRAEKALRRSEKEYRSIIENIIDIYYRTDPEGNLILASPSAVELFGYDSVEQLIGKNLAKDFYYRPEDRTIFLKELNDHGKVLNYEVTLKRKDGTPVIGETNSHFIYDEEGNVKGVEGIFRDLTLRRRAEAAVRESDKRYRLLFESAGDAIFLIEAEGKNLGHIVDANPAAAQMHGYTITDMITIHDKDFNIVRANKAATDILGLSCLETAGVKCHEVFHGINRPLDDCLSCECYDTGKPASFEMFEPHLDRFLEVRAMPRLDNTNRLTGLIHVIRDITERKKVEEALQRAEQMKLVGEWAAGLAHEIKNPLAGIKVSVEVLLEELNISAEDRAIVLRAVDEIKRIEALLKSLLNFAKPPKLQLTNVDMNDLMDQTAAFALKHPSLSSDSSIKITVTRDFDENLPLTMADPMQMQQVFLNLLYNAIEAMPEGGTLGVTSAYDKNQAAITIQISDTGKGIDQGAMDDVFKPFYTTKSKGSGLGLAITRRIVEEHGGVVSATSDPGKWTRVYVNLPIIRDL